MTSPATLTLSFLPTCMLKLPHSNYTLFSRQNMTEKRALACTLVPLPHISYSCHCGLTDSPTEDGGLVSPNIPLPNIPLPLPQTPICQALTQLLPSLKQLLKPHILCHWLDTHSGTTRVLLDHWTSPRCQMGQKAVYLEARGLQADNLMKLWTSDFFIPTKQCKLPVQIYPKKPLQALIVKAKKSK